MDPETRRIISEAQAQSDANYDELVAQFREAKEDGIKYVPLAVDQMIILAGQTQRYWLALTNIAEALLDLGDGIGSMPELIEKVAVETHDALKADDEDDE